VFLSSSLRFFTVVWPREREKEKHTNQPNDSGEEPDRRKRERKKSQQSIPARAVARIKEKLAGIH